MRERISETLKKHTWILYVFFALIQLMFMFYQCGKQSMWLDEMSLLGTITKDKSLRDILWQYIAVDVTNLPLFPLVAALWYRLLPANDRLMLLLPGIFAAASLVVTASIAERNFGKREGIFSAVLMFISIRPVINCGFELRAYAFMLFFAALTLYFYFGKNTEKDMKSRVLFALSVLLLIYTHYSGAILVAVLALIDFVKVFLKKLKFMDILPYFAAGVLFLPWFILMLVNKEKSISSFWVDPPTVPEIARTLKFLLSNNEAIYVLFLISLVIVLVRISESVFKKEPSEDKVCTAFEMLAAVFSMIFIVFIYSAVINPGGGFFVKRYFLVLLPTVISVTAFGYIRILDFISTGNGAEDNARLFAVLSLFVLIYFGFVNLSEIRETSGTSWETFREAAAYVRNEGILEGGEDTALVCSVNPRASAGFAEYYVRRGGRENAVNTVSLQGEDPVREMSRYDRIYLVYVHRDLENLDPGIKETLDRDYRLVKEDESVRAAVYERKQ